MVIAELGPDVGADQRDKSMELLAKMRRRMPAGALQTVQLPMSLGPRSACSRTGCRRVNTSRSTLASFQLTRVIAVTLNVAAEKSVTAEEALCNWDSQ